jgi:hypothetical protein
VSRSTLFCSGVRASRLVRREGGTCFDVNGQGPGDVTDAEAVSEIVGGSAQEMTERLAKVYERTAAVLGKSAALAEEHAERRERAGRSEAAVDERRAAERARRAAQRADAAADRAREPAKQRRSHERHPTAGPGH